MYPQNFVTRLVGRYDKEAVSEANAISFPEVGLTVQSEKDDCDINTIVERFGITGTMPVARYPAEYGDFSGVWDFQSAMSELVKSREAFMELPAELRDRFQNDPGRLLQFVHDDRNYDQAVQMGLVPPRPVLKPADEPPKPVKDSEGSDKPKD